MNDKKWYENIPENGVLCKCSDGSYKLITSIENDYHMDDCTIYGVSDFGEDEIDYLTPLTADEWWKFAPWQDMDSAPRDGSDITAITKDSGGKICTAYYDPEEECFITDFKSNGNFYRVFDFKWLPLPKARK